MPDPHSTSRSRQALGVLYEEHLLLGAAFGEDRMPLRYAGGDEPGSVRSSTVLADVSASTMLLASGGPAPAFAHAAFAGAELGVGECAFEAVLTGDGAIASVPLLVRTGDSEYLAIDPTQRAEVLDGWLSFLAGVSQDGVAPFEGLDTSDVTSSHALLLLWGARAREVLSDYLGNEHAPASGRVASLLLDSIPCIVARLPEFEEPCYLLFVPPVHAKALWRSLLSFTEVTPVGQEGLWRLVDEALPWAHATRANGVMRLGRGELLGWGLVRQTGDYVGARGLAAAEGGVAT